MSPVINAISAVEQDQATPSGRDDWFVAVHGGGRVGRYGPVPAEVARYVEQDLAGPVTGAPVMDHNGLHAALRGAAGPNTTSVASWAVGAADCAAWDLRGQIAQAPVAQLLAPAPETIVPLYASWLGLDVTIPASLAVVRDVSSGGWQFTKWALRKKSHGDLRAEAARLVSAALTVATALAQPAAFDAVFTWDTTLARLITEQLDRASLLWLEDPLHDYDADAYHALAPRVPLALGERLLVHDDAQALLGLRPRAFTLDVVACGGLTRAVELVTRSCALGVPVFPHGRSFIPGLHLAAAFPHAVPAVEYRLHWEPRRQQLYKQPWLPAKGLIKMPTSPGLSATPRNC
jgi:L-alanine-DL-glutamate epimerase-like enolase superfamily enzyme